MMTGKVGLAGALVVWLVYVIWMVQFYSSTFTQFTH
jgi:hypothetical protein